MDQPGNGHFTLHLNQQSANGRGGYHGRAGYEGNGHSASGNNGNGQGAKRYNGHVAAPSGGQHDQRGHRDQQAHGGPRQYSEYAEYIQASAAAPDASAIQDASAGPEASADDRHHDDAPQDSVPHSSAADRMRQLLARSTAGHAASERATSTALEEIQRRLAGLERVVAELRDRAGAEPDIATSVAEQIAPQAQRLAGLSATLDGVSAGMSTVSTQLAAVDGRLTGIDSRLASNDAKHASTEGRVSALDTRFERLDERLDDQYDRVSSIDNRLAAADSRIAGLGGQFAESLTVLAEEVRARPGRTEIEELVTKIVENAHTDLATRLSSLEDTVLTLAEALLGPPGHRVS